MYKEYNNKLISNAKDLRRNMTPEERHLWYDFLKKLPLTVNRQKVIDNYIVDFFIASKKCVIEIDGRQHLTEEHRIADTKRDSDLNSHGFNVLRYSNRDINRNFNSVCLDILKNLSLEITDLT